MKGLVMSIYKNFRKDNEKKRSFFKIICVLGCYSTAMIFSYGTGYLNVFSFLKVPNWAKNVGILPFKLLVDVHSQKYTGYRVVARVDLGTLRIGDVLTDLLNRATMYQRIIKLPSILLEPDV